MKKEEDARKECPDASAETKKFYVKPQVRSEKIYVQAQSCGKCESGGPAQVGCLSVPQAS